MVMISAICDGKTVLDKLYRLYLHMFFVSQTHHTCSHATTNNEEIMRYTEALNGGFNIINPMVNPMSTTTQNHAEHR
jgi:hypothetical protein